MALAATADGLLKAKEELLRNGQTVATDSSWTFMLFLNATATAVPACKNLALDVPGPSRHWTGGCLRPRQSYGRSGHGRD